MAKRARATKAPKAEVYTGEPLAAVRSVLLHPPTLRALIGNRPQLDLPDLWSLYQCCSATRIALYDHPDIVVYRKARIEHHGDLHYPLVDAFTKERDARLLRCLRHHLRECGLASHHRAVPAWNYACGISVEYAKMLRAEFAVGTGDILQFALLYGPDDVDFIQQIITFCGLKLPLCPADAGCSFTGMVRRGNLKVALVTLVNHRSPGEYALSFVWSGHPVMMKYAQDHWPEDYDRVCVDFATRQKGWFALGEGNQLNALRAIASRCNVLGVKVDYEVLYVHFMCRTSSPDVKAVLEWLRPLALRQFQRRRAVDRHALPLFMTEESRRELRENTLLPLYLHTGANAWNTFPRLLDQRHYAWGHNTNPLPARLAPALGILRYPTIEEDDLPPGSEHDEDMDDEDEPGGGMLGHDDFYL